MISTAYTALPNNILEKILKEDFTKIEMKIVLFVIRYTLGYHRDDTPLSLSFISSGTVTDKRRVSESIKKLIKKRILIETSAPTFNAPREVRLSPDFATVDENGVDKTAYCGVDKTAYRDSGQNVNQEKKYINKYINKHRYPKEEEKASTLKDGFDPDEFFKAALKKAERR